MSSSTPLSDPNPPTIGVVRNREDATITTTTATTNPTTESDIQLTGLLPRPESDSHKKLRRTTTNTSAGEEGNVFFLYLVQ